MKMELLVLAYYQLSFLASISLIKMYEYEYILKELLQLWLHTCRIALFRSLALSAFYQHDNHVTIIHCMVSSF